MSLDSIVNVNITTLAASVAQAGFGTPMCAAYFPTSVFPERVREYSSLTGMTDDGFPASHPAYLMATALKSQNPSVTAWKVGRKALPSVQTIDITPTITTAGEVLRVTVEGTEVSYTIPAAATVASICTALQPLLDAINGVSAADNTTHVTVTPNRQASTRLTVDTAANNEDFSVFIDGTEYKYTSDATATVTEIRDGLKALIDAGTQATTASVSTDSLDLTATSLVGSFFAETAGGAGAMSYSLGVSSYDLLSVASPSKGITLKDNTPDPGVATDLSAIEAEDSDWYGLLIDSESETEINAAAAWAEARTVLFLASSIDTGLKDAGTTTDVGSDLRTAAYARTALIFSESSQQYGGARLAGRMLPKAPGSATWAYKKLSGFNTVILTDTEKAALEGKNVNYYINQTGVNATFWGESASGEYLDITRGVDWFTARLQERLYNLLANNDKLPFDQSTRGLIYAEIFAQMSEAQDAQVLQPDTDDFPWVIDIKDPSTISQVNRAARLWPDTEFSAYLAGAVHTLKLTGTLSV